MEFLSEQCAAQSVGAANGLFGILFQTLMAAHCALAKPDRWPKDFGPTAIEKGVSCTCQVVKVFVDNKNENLRRTR